MLNLQNEFWVQFKATFITLALLVAYVSMSISFAMFLDMVICMEVALLELSALIVVAIRYVPGILFGVYGDIHAQSVSIA